MGTFNYNIFLNEVLSQIKQEFEANNKETEYILWFSNIKYVESEELKIIVSIPSNMVKDKLITSGYLNLIESKLLEISGYKIKVDLTVKNITNNSSKKENIINELPVKPKVEVKKHPQLNERYTFENFVKGDNNSFAYNASIAVSKNPGKAYNPMLIYGGVGLGKTHLMESIGNAIYNEKQNNVIYVTAETFTNEFIQSINTNSVNKFKNKYRNADILLLDDIHFLMGKKETQEELFNTFEALYNSNKQLVFTCDRPVTELKDMNERLISRFGRGLSVDLQAPQYETRLAILQKKAEIEKIDVKLEVIELIAKNVCSNVRDLEAALTKIKAFAELMEQEITLETAQHLLRDSFSDPKQGNISIEIIQKVVADKYGISVSDLKGKKRNKNVVIPRQFAMFIARELTEYSTTDIGTEFGGRDHTTVMHSCQKVDELLISDPTVHTTIEMLKRAIKDYKK
ncbi:MAG: chromosomal replication initiator protein DnaA [Spirochaetaceae bacterium]|nr:chromosomal replication initiator protein DnaA [Spirochaetaceae bacterium]